MRLQYPYLVSGIYKTSCIQSLSIIRSPTIHGIQNINHGIWCDLILVSLTITGKRLSYACVNYTHCVYVIRVRLFPCTQVFFIDFCMVKCLLQNELVFDGFTLVVWHFFFVFEPDEFCRGRIYTMQTFSCTWATET